MSTDSPNSSPESESASPQETPNQKGNDVDRRSFLGASSTALMVGGVGGSYGTLAFMAGRYLYPSTDPRKWLFVCRVDELAPGDARPFASPTGVKVTITRTAANNVEEVNADQFLALSSICPHLGCKVHWEAHNDRYFCPCHNGVFDATGKATEGPPAAAKQVLPAYPLRVENDNLFIQMNVESVVPT